MSTELPLIDIARGTTDPRVDLTPKTTPTPVIPDHSYCINATRLIRGWQLNNNEDATKRDGDDNNNKLHPCQFVKMRDNDT